MTLVDYLHEIYAVQRCISDNTQYQYDRSIRCLSEWLGHAIRIADLSDLLVSRWIRYLEQLWAPRTVAAKRRDVLVVWRDAARAGMCQPPGFVRRPRVPATNPVAWSLEEMRALIESTGKLTGDLANGLPRSRYFRCLLETGYQTGLRRGDLLAFDVSNVAGDVAAVTQCKTDQWHLVAVEPATAECLIWLSRQLVEMQDPYWQTPLRWPHNIRWLTSSLDRLCRLADVPGGGLQRVRRTGATAIAAAGGDPMQYLGHKTPGLAYRCYVDRTKTGAAVRPPSV